MRRKKDPFDRNRIKAEIDSLIRDINKVSVNEELKNPKLNLYNIVVVNTKTIKALGILLKKLNELAHIHSSLFQDIIKTIKRNNQDRQDKQDTQDNQNILNRRNMFILAGCNIFTFAIMVILLFKVF